MSTKKSIEEIVEEFAELIGCDYTGDDATECNWLRTTLQSERDRAEEEKNDLYWELHLLLKEVEKHQSPLTSTDWVKEKLEALINPQD